MLRLHDGKRAHFRYWRVLLIIIESGMVYSVALVCEITLYFLNSNAFYIVYDPIAQLTVRAPSFLSSFTSHTNPYICIRTPETGDNTHGDHHSRRPPAHLERRPLPSHAYHEPPAPQAERQQARPARA
jgi:hypothetical protein